MLWLEDYFPRFKPHLFPALPPVQACRQAVKQLDPLHRAPWVVHGAPADPIPAPDVRMVAAAAATLLSLQHSKLHGHVTGIWHGTL